MTEKPPYMAEESERLRAIYKQRKALDRNLTQARVAYECDWGTQSVVSQYMTGKIPLNLPALLALSRALDFKPEEVSPRLAKLIESGYNSEPIEEPNLHLPHKPATRLLPVIGYVQAGSFCEAVDLFQPGEADEWIPAHGPAGLHAFVLRVEGFSMEPDFKPGDKVVIDPDMQWNPGDFVLAKRVSDQGVTLKQVRMEGGEHYLYATNPAWPERIIKLDEEWLICGRVRRKIVDY